MKTKRFTEWINYVWSYTKGTNLVLRLYFIFSFGKYLCRLKADKHLWRRRLYTCYRCPLRDERICLGCDCYIPYKALEAEAKCPVNKWDNL